MSTDLANIVLTSGSHPTSDDGLCLMEAVAYVGGMPHSDHPPCVSPVLAGFGRRLNDVLPDDVRQDLVPLIPHLMGTAGDGQDVARAYLAMDWLVRVYTPAWLDAAGLVDEAETLRALDAITDEVAARGALPAVRSARAVAGDVAWDVARAVAGDRLAPTVATLQRSAIQLYTAMAGLQQT